MSVPTQASAAFAIAGLVLALSATACTLPEAFGKPRPPAADAGVGKTERKGKPAKPDAGVRGKHRQADPSSLVGLTQAQVVARKGQPTAKKGNVWVYTPHRPGCRERIFSELVIFEGDEVVKEDISIEETGKICAERE